MVARELAVRTRESEDADETVALAGAFHKASRVVRLTLALQFKLEREAARDAQAAAREAEAAARLRAADPATQPPPDRTEARKSRVRGLLNRLLWNECEGDADDYEVLYDDLAVRLDEAALSADFEALPIDELARRIAADMDLSGDLVLSLREANAATAPAPGTAAAHADTG
jgi:hypothetical protein